MKKEIKKILISDKYRQESIKKYVDTRLRRDYMFQDYLVDKISELKETEFYWIKKNISV